MRQEAEAREGSVIIQVGRDLVVMFQKSPRLRWGTALVVLVVLAWLVWPDAQPQRGYAQPSPWFESPVPASSVSSAPSVTASTAVPTTTVPPGDVVTTSPEPPGVVPVPTTTAAAAVAVASVPKIVIAVGEPTSSSRCERGKCYWIDTWLTGFAANTAVSVEPIGNQRSFSDPCRAVTDASGAVECNDTRYDVPGAEVYVYVDTPQGRVESNRITWPS